MALGCTASSLAHAEPQGNAGLTIGGAAVASDAQFDEGYGAFHLGLRGDVLFGQSSSEDFGIGPYLELGTLAFDELQLGGGASVLLPVIEDWPLVPSLGAFGRIGDDDHGFEPGIAAALFWGTRAYNYHARYAMTGGLLLGYRHSFGESKQTALLIAAQTDLAFIGIPLVALIDLMRGPSAECQTLPEGD